MATHKTTFDMENLKKIKEQMQNIQSEAKKENINKKSGDEEIPKQSLGNKIVGIIVLIVIIALVGIVIVLNFDLLFMPKNSVTVVVSDQNGDVIDGLNLYVSNENKSFYIDYEQTSGTSITEVGVTPGTYTLIFHDIPEGYSCLKLVDEFTLSEGGKVKLEYECTKEK